MSWPLVDPVLTVLRGAPRRHDELASWIEERYGIPIIDVVDDPMRDAPRLAVWVRTEAEKNAFRSGYNFDAAKQAAIAEAAGRPGVLVIFCDAERVLRERATTAVGPSSYMHQRTVLDHPGSVWKIYALFGHVWVFLETDAQVAALTGTAQHMRLVDALWALVHAHDEFGVVPREAFTPTIDSKQNLDENFEGNSYYYHR